ncbi:MAG TPA: AAA family ATPase [Polyangia bacterium]|nr:AAA family ATPase [Polyangia bacterium]
MMRPRQLWVLAGGNGAGKSTFYRFFLKPRGIALVNADDIARALRPDAPEGASYDAATDAEILRGRLIESGASFCFETVFSHPSKIDFIARARALGYRVILVFFHLGDAALNLARISQRVAAGGHDVPDDKVRARLPRTLANVKAALPLFDEVILVDNSSADDPFRVVARIAGGTVRADRAAPVWVLSLIAAAGPERTRS